MPEYGREYWDRHQVNRRLAPEQLVELAEGHLEREDRVLERANRFLFTDTNAITTLTFARYYHGAAPRRLVAMAAEALTRYDLMFVCGDEIPYDETWDRSGPGGRAAFQRQVFADLLQRKVPFITLRGTLDERVAQVRRVLNVFHKYMNVIDLVRYAPA